MYKYCKGNIKRASSDAVSFHKIPQSCCKACPEVSMMACWEGNGVKEQAM